MTTAEKIAVMQAFVDGKTIQINNGDGWRDHHATPLWDWARSSYRVKPEPREWWLVSGRPGCRPLALSSEAAAQELKVSTGDTEVIHVREVID